MLKRLRHLSRARLLPHPASIHHNGFVQCQQLHTQCADHTALQGLQQLPLMSHVLCLTDGAAPSSPPSPPESLRLHEPYRPHTPGNFKLQIEHRAPCCPVDEENAHEDGPQASDVMPLHCRRDRGGKMKVKFRRQQSRTRRLAFRALRRRRREEGRPDYRKWIGSEYVAEQDWKDIQP